MLPLAATIRDLQSASIPRTKHSQALPMVKLKKVMLLSFVMKVQKADQVCRKCLLLLHKSWGWDLVPRSA
ncbi:hypothetical protein D3C71_1988150 [compost metagenome]